mgnify:CR=1 FL=1
MVLVLWSELSDTNTRASLSANEFAYTVDTSDNAVWDLHLAAQGWQMYDVFDWVKVVWKDDEFGSLLFYGACDLIVSRCDLYRCRFLLVTVESRFCVELYATSALLFGFFFVTTSQIEHRACVFGAQSIVELVDCRRDAQSVLQNFEFASHDNIFWPPDITN